ncbi:hypothetical protein R3W88_005817 [Solanum pinnatisectum]|uniref:SMODS and SLOG-associating 2TM effector domain-containing protein n=1 Tax=Solanum pinnatisectum TaxID=50273 RepID=A0AAV9KFF1_9SOLN|nr:hypothetical protein R3W88_005817 [Solanum pinnatisectum]
MAGTEYITIDFIEVPSCPLRSNVVKLLEVEQRRKAIYEKKWDLELQALKVVSKLKQHTLFLFALTGGISIYLTTKIPSAVCFAISILLMCLFLADSFIRIGMAKSRITTMNMLIMDLTQRYKDLREETRNLMEFERSKKGRLANVVDNSEGPVMDMDSFIARTKTIYDDTTDFSDFEKAFHKMIYVSWGIGGIFIPAVLFMSFCNYYYGQDSPSPDKLSFAV